MGYAITYKTGVKKQLKNLPKNIQARLLDKISNLSLNPRPMGYKKLAASENVYRFRIGNYRVLYSIWDKELVILIVKISHRKDVYRK